MIRGCAGEHGDRAEDRRGSDEERDRLAVVEGSVQRVDPAHEWRCECTSSVARGVEKWEVTDVDANPQRPRYVRAADR